MPSHKARKHQHHYAHLAKTSSSSSSSSSSSFSPASAPFSSGKHSSADSNSITHRLEQSRRAAHRPRTTIEALERAAHATALATAPSVPGATWRLLQLPETVPIRVRASAAVDPERRARTGRRGTTAVAAGRAGTAGPPPPRSWALATSRFAPERERALAREAQAGGSSVGVRGTGHTNVMAAFEQRYSALSRLRDAAKLELLQLPRRGSLKDYAFKALARAWTALRGEMRYADFDDGPTGMKSVLVAYLIAMGVDVGKDDLALLFSQRDCLDLHRLALVDVIGRSLSLKDLSRFLVRPRRGSSTLDKTEKDVTHTACSTEYETWEDEENIAQVHGISRPLGSTAFVHLTRLLLGKPGPSATWVDLLELAPRLHLVTHLSLAYWPVPLLHPEEYIDSWAALTRGLPSDHVRYKGPKTLDSRDWDEPAHVLRTLSKATYSLQWLDLEGCNDWLPALAVTPDLQHTDATASSAQTIRIADPQAPHDRPTTASSSSSDEQDALWRDGIRTQTKGPDWAGSWSRLRHVCVKQAWQPGRRVKEIGINRSLVLHTRDAYELDRRDELAARGLADPVAQTPKEEEQRRELEELEYNAFALRYMLWQLQTLEDERTASRVRALATAGYVKFDHGWRVNISGRLPNSQEYTEWQNVRQMRRDAEGA